MCYFLCLICACTTQTSLSLPTYRAGGDGKKDFLKELEEIFDLVNEGTVFISASKHITPLEPTF